MIIVKGKTVKKLIISIISILSTISLTFGIAGCVKEGNGQGQSASEPGTQNPIVIPMPKYIAFSNFEEFKNYYETEFSAINSERFYLLSPAMESINGGFTSSFSFTGEETLNLDEPFINPVIEEYFIVYSEELGTGVDLNLETGAPAISFDMGITLYPVSQNHEHNKDFVFEFSEYTGKFKWQYTVKIYENETLIGECFYYQTVEIPQSWMENYLRKNLI